MQPDGPQKLPEVQEVRREAAFGVGRAASGRGGGFLSAGTKLDGSKEASKKLPLRKCPKKATQKKAVF